MAVDFAYRKILIDSGEQEAAKVKLVKLIDDCMERMMFSKTELEEESDWSYFLLNDNDDWLHFADVGWMEYEDDIIKEISRIYPVISVRVIEEYLVTLTLHDNNELKGQFANRDFMQFDCQEFNKKLNIDEWLKFIGLDCEPSELINLWTIFESENGRKGIHSSFSTLLMDTFEIFGWNYKLAWGGYYIDSEGLVGRGIDPLLKENLNRKWYQPIQQHYKFIGPKSERRYRNIWDTLGWKN